MAPIGEIQSPAITYHCISYRIISVHLRWLKITGTQRCLEQSGFCTSGIHENIIFFCHAMNQFTLPTTYRTTIIKKYNWFNYVFVDTKYSQIGMNKTGIITIYVTIVNHTIISYHRPSSRHLRSRYFLSQKLWHFHKNIRSWAENECCYPRPFTFKILLQI